MELNLVSRAIVEYFQGERSEMIVIISTSVVLAALMIWLLFLFKDSFTKGLVWTVLVVCLLLASTAVSLLLRDKALKNNLLSNIKGDETQSSLKKEADRIEVIISKYATYRLVSIGLIILMLASALVFKNGAVYGILVGTLVFAAAQLTIDHYSEKRAIAYKVVLYQSLDQIH